ENAFRNPQLQEIDLSSSSINFAADTVDADCFAGCPKLEFLVLAGNDFSDVTQKKFSRLFSQVTQLKWLSLASAHISRISAGHMTKSLTTVSRSASHQLYISETGLSLDVLATDSSRYGLTRQQHGLPNLNLSAGSTYMSRSRSTYTDTAGLPVIHNPCPNPDFIVENYTVCGDGNCRCRDTVADCSEHHGKLTYVPRLPAGISQVLFTDKILVRILRDDFFVNITNVTDLDLSNNRLTYISPGVFRPFTNLTALRLMANNLTYTTLAPVLSVTTLTVLDLTYNPLGPPPNGIFHTYPLLQLESLCLSGNKIASLNMTVLKPLVERISMVSSGINFASDTTDADCFAGCPKLEELFLDSNDFSDVTQKKFSRLFSQVILLKRLSLASAHISRISA
ncbi:hypothetical protein BaRGS_00024527, partial [Batillaria attramentaria]